MVAALHKLATDSAGGTTALEYAILAAFIAVGLVTAIGSIGQQVDAMLLAVLPGLSRGPGL